MNNITADHTGQLWPHQHLPTVQQRSPRPVLFATTSGSDQNVPAKGHTLSNMRRVACTTPTAKGFAHHPCVAHQLLKMPPASGGSHRGGTTRRCCTVCMWISDPHTIRCTTDHMRRTDKQACSQKNGYLDRHTPNGRPTCIL